MEAYKRWVQRNRDYVHSLESLANGLTWLLPERFSESEIGPEAVTSLLGIITTINEHILETTTHTRTGHLESSSSSSFPSSLCITLLKDLETLVEVIAQQFYGEDKKWNFMAVTESIK
ncbi:peroxisome biogenesis protein 16 [Phtheirospermum japonicum]|uniref:Peroxisomal membrane protein PEX16 n=1 Tax=Phtheirospermum japonicum TaxID=374723 RepID=A0A830CRL5_9LAMI|nr:peroxisome biogenesis protein 16 [Phtheirospermum japonicum]